MVRDIDNWLESLGLSRYSGLFTENEIDFDVLTELTEQDLKDLQIPLGHRKRLLKGIAAIHDDAGTSNHRIGSVDGTSLPMRPEAERRQLTVMFADLVGSTALSQQFDPEDLRDITRAYQTAATAAIVENEGYVAKYMGDGILAYFGYPQAQEDDAERAVRAGLKLIASVAGADLPVELAVRVGIATGPVVVGDLIGDGASQENAVVGQTPNHAARLQNAADPNTVAISDSTRAMVHGLFNCTDLGSRQLKGFTNEIRLWRVDRERPTESRFEALHSEHRTPFVGRASELGLLLDRWKTVVAGEGQVVLLEGEAGVGKSRLADEFRRAIGSEAHILIRYQCSSHRMNSAFFPFISQLQNACNIGVQDDISERLNKLERIVLTTQQREKALWLFANLLSLPADRYPQLALDPQQFKMETIAAFRDQLIAACRDTPLLVLFEDVHWIDPTSREVIDTLIEGGQFLPVLFVLTHRPEFTPSWRGRGFVTELRLNHLTRRDGLSIIRQVARGKDLPEEITQQILAKTEGVALFIEELTKTVLESGLLIENPTGYALVGPLPELAIPSTLRDSLMARLDRLSVAKEIAQVGACIGREFSHELLNAVTGLPEGELSRCLEQLLDNQLIFRRGTPPNALYSFKHALVQDAAYESLLLARRRTIHASILATLEAAHQGNPDEVIELLAHHARRAELWDKAVIYLRKAGSKAYARSAGQESRAYYKQALDILGTLPENTNNLELAFEIRLEMRPVLNQLGLPRRMLERLQEAERIAERLKDNYRRGQVCALVTIAHSQLGETDEALGFGTRALNIAKELGDLKLRILATTYLELVHYYRGDYRPVVDLAVANLQTLPAEWMHEYFGASAPPSVYDRSWLVQSLAQLGRFSDAARYTTELLKIAEATRHPFSIGQAHRGVVTFHLLTGEWATANSLCEQWVSVVRAGNVAIQLPWAISTWSWALAQIGESNAAAERLKEGEQLIGRQAELGLVATQGWDYHALARASLLLGYLDDARRLGERAVGCSMKHPGFKAYGLHLLGDTATHPNECDAERGETHYLEALTLAEMQAMRPLIAHCHFGLGKVYRRKRNPKTADEHLTAAVGMYREMNMAYWETIASQELTTPA